MLSAETLNSLYQNGAYLESNPHWHVEDSPWKAAQILRALEQTGLTPRTVAEIGCGAGEILRQLQLRLPGSRFTGYELSPDAYKLCLTRRQHNLEFRNEDPLTEGNREYVDLLLVIDVVEHVEDCFTFLKKCRPKAAHTIFHLPLDLSVQTLLRPQALLEERRRVGHIHYFTKETALACISEAGYRVIHSFHTCKPMDEPHRQLYKKLINGSRKLLYSVSPDAAARWLGGFSLMVVAEG